MQNSTGLHGWEVAETFLALGKYGFEIVQLHPAGKEPEEDGTIRPFMYVFSKDQSDNDQIELDVAVHVYDDAMVVHLCDDVPNAPEGKSLIGHLVSHNILMVIGQHTLVHYAERQEDDMEEIDAEAMN